MQMKYRIENMTCGGCARGVTKAIHTVDASAEISGYLRCLDGDAGSAGLQTGTFIANALPEAGLETSAPGGGEI